VEEDQTEEFREVLGMARSELTSLKSVLENNLGDEVELRAELVKMTEKLEKVFP
jgi:hypothetical protein